ncbi:MAG: hypothetical protein R2724_25550 [Bryobacterales bacterium]
MRRRIEEHFSVERLATRTEQRFRDLLEGPSVQCVSNEQSAVELGR